MKKIILAFLIAIMSATFAAADTILLRDGRTITGTVLGFVNGRFAVRLTAALPPLPTAQTNPQGDSPTLSSMGEVGDVIYIHPRNIQRVEISGRSLADARYLVRSVRVQLGPNWVDTGIDLQRGETIRVGGTGAITIGGRRITPAGLRSTDPNAPLPNAAEGELIGAIGDDPNSPIIEIGLNREFTADRDGRLYLTANSNDFTDARGAFIAQIRREIRVAQQTAGGRDDDYSDDLFGGGGSNQPGRVRRRTNRGGGQTQPPISTGDTSQERSISVPGNSRGTDTGIDLHSGDNVDISATGTVVAGQRAGSVSPDGGSPGLGALLGTRPVPSAGVGALVGYLRTPDGQESQRFMVGSRRAFSAPADGRLFLLINDDDYSDNSGSFNVRIVRTGSQGGQSGGGGSFPSQGGEREVTVFADSRDTDTGIDLRSGQRVTFSATGSVYSRNTGAITPEGNRRYGAQSGNYPMRDAAFGALVGYLRTPDGRASRPFYIGSQQTVTMPENGRLYLLVNDDDNRDNSGSFRVRVAY